MFKVKYVDSIMMLVRLDLNLIVSLFQHKCEVSETAPIPPVNATLCTALIQSPMYCLLVIPIALDTHTPTQQSCRYSTMLLDVK